MPLEFHFRLLEWKPYSGNVGPTKLHVYSSRLSLQHSIETTVVKKFFKETFVEEDSIIQFKFSSLKQSTLPVQLPGPYNM